MVKKRNTQTQTSTYSVTQPDVSDKSLNMQITLNLFQWQITHHTSKIRTQKNAQTNLHVHTHPCTHTPMCEDFHRHNVLFSTLPCSPYIPTNPWPQAQAQPWQSHLWLNTGAENAINLSVEAPSDRAFRTGVSWRSREQATAAEKKAIFNKLPLLLMEWDIAEYRERKPQKRKGVQRTTYYTIILL